MFDENMYKQKRFPTREDQCSFFLAEALKGEAVAQYFVGCCYWYGDGVQTDFNEALKWYHLSAEQGFDKAQLVLGGRYQLGQFVEKNDQIAFGWYKKAAEQGHSCAQNNVGDFYEKGQGVEKDYQQAKEWYLKAAKQQCEIACFNLGMMYKQGVGVAVNEQEARQWFTQALRSEIYYPALIQLDELRKKYALQVLEEDNDFDLISYQAASLNIYSLSDVGKDDSIEEYGHLLERCGANQITQLFINSGLCTTAASVDEMQSLVANESCFLGLLYDQRNAAMWNEDSESYWGTERLMSELCEQLLPDLKLEWLEEDLTKPYIWLNGLKNTDCVYKLQFESCFLQVNNINFAFSIYQAGRAYSSTQADIVVILNKLLAFLGKQRRCYFYRGGEASGMITAFLAKEEEFEKANKVLNIPVYKPTHSYRPSLICPLYLRIKKELDEILWQQGFYSQLTGEYMLLARPKRTANEARKFIASLLPEMRQRAMLLNQDNIDEFVDIRNLFIALGRHLIGDLYAADFLSVLLPLKGASEQELGLFKTLSKVDFINVFYYDDFIRQQFYYGDMIIEDVVY